MNIQETARKNGVKALLVFGVLTLTGYYIYLKKRKDSVFANAGGSKISGNNRHCPKGWSCSPSNYDCKSCINQNNPGQGYMPSIRNPQ